MTKLGKKSDAQAIEAFLDQTMIGLDADAFELVLQWLERPASDEESEGMDRLRNASFPVWASVEYPT